MEEDLVQIILAEAGDTLGERIRPIAEAVGGYAESGPTFDPDGDYLCGTCKLRLEPDACVTVSGKISMTTGSCYQYIKGDQEFKKPFEIQFTQNKAGYSERSNDKAFGCKNCEYSEEAKIKDSKGRESWCQFWNMGIIPEACCYRSDSEDDVWAPGENDKDVDAYGTSQGAEEGWDTRGRGRKFPDRDVHIYDSGKWAKQKAIVQKIFDSLPETHKNLLRDQNLLVYLKPRALGVGPEGGLAGGVTQQSEHLPLMMMLPLKMGTSQFQADMGTGLFKEIVTHEFGHAFHYSGGMNDQDWKDYEEFYNPKTKLSERARSNIREHFAEAYQLYLRNPERLKKYEPETYKFMQKRFEE